MSERIQCIVAYPSRTPDGSPAKFDMKYYLSVHMAMINKYWGPHGMKSWNVAEFPTENPLDGSAMPYIVQTTVEWESLDGFKSAATAPTGKETMADIPNFTDVVPQVWVNKIVGENTL